VCFVDDLSVRCTCEMFWLYLAGNVVLQKLLAVKGVPDNCVFVSIDQNGHVCPVTYVSLRQFFVCFLTRVLTSRLTLFDDCYCVHVTVTENS